MNIRLGPGAATGNDEAANPRLGYRPELDGIRGIAVLLVIANHAGLLPDSAGNAGVTAFFVLSGYLITSLLMVERRASGGVDLRAFYVRRARRLLPALAALLVVTGIWMMTRSELGVYVPRALAATFYLADLAPLIHLPLAELSHTWSLSLEEQFYLVWPAVFVLMRRPRGWLALAALVAVVGQLVIPDGPARFVTRADGLIAGCLLAISPVALRAWPLAWLAFAAAALSSAPIVVATISSVGLLSTAAQARWLKIGPLVRIGQISYGLYLWHFVLFALLQPLWLATIATFVIALVSEQLVERPFRRVRDPEYRVSPARAVG